MECEKEFKSKITPQKVQQILNEEVNTRRSRRCLELSTRNGMYNSEKVSK
ncbi:MAG: hypothetical protein ACN6OI_19505 [Flavobacterium sp.]